MGAEKNGIVGLDDMFNIGPGEEVYNREEDILSLSGNLDSSKTGEEPLKEGSNVIDEKEKKDDSVVDIKDNKNDNHIEDPKNDSHVDNVPVVDYRNVLNSLSSRGVIPDLKDVVFSGENGEELTIEDLDFTKEDSLCDVIATIIENQKEDIVRDKIDVGSVSDITKKLIQADKAGANIVDILKQYDTFTAPIEKLDIENKADQIKIIRHYVDLLGLPKDEADEFYKGIINKGEEYVEAKAIKYKAELDKKMDSIIQQKTQAAAEKKAKDMEDFKKYKKDLKSSIQAKYQLNDNMVSKALDFALKSSDENPGVTKAIQKVRDMMKNPEEAPDLIMFLMNPDEFIKQKSNQTVSEEKKRIYKMISRTPKERTTAPIDEKGKEVVGVTFDEIRLD